jgi:HKD family nuclease
MTEAALAKIRLLILPYPGGEPGSVAELLIKELKSGRWSRFAAAVAFAKHSGNYVELLAAMRAFAQAGNRIELTFGANMFGPEAAATDYEAIATLLARLEDTGNATVYLYRDRQRTFHPKVYLFDNEKKETALLIVGSSNWTDGGLHNNVEANLIVDLDLTDSDERNLFKELRTYFQTYWQESDA